MSGSSRARFVTALASTTVGLGGCAGPTSSDGLLLVPFFVAFVAGLIAAAAIIAVGFSRPGSWLHRLAYVVLALGLWFVLACLGFFYVLVTHPMV